MLTRFFSNLSVLLLVCVLSASLPLISAQELYRDPEVVREELKQKLISTDDYLKKYPEKVSHYVERGEIYAELYNLSKEDAERTRNRELALADFAKAIVLDPNYYRTYFKRAELKRRFGYPERYIDFDQTVADYLEAIRLAQRTEHSESLEGYESPVAPIFSELSKFYSERARTAVRDGYLLEKLREVNKQYSYWNDFDAAIDYAKKGMPNYPFFPMSQMSQKAEAAYTAGEYDMALAVYEEQEKYWQSKLDYCKKHCKDQIQSIPDSFRRERAKIFIKLEQWGKALQNLNDFLINPYHRTCPQPYFARAKVYRGLGRINLALADEKTASKLPAPPITCEIEERDWK